MLGGWAGVGGEGRWEGELRGGANGGARGRGGCEWGLAGGWADSLIDMPSLTSLLFRQLFLNCDVTTSSTMTSLPSLL